MKYDIRKKLLHFILDLGIISENKAYTILSAAIEGGADIIQLRAKEYAEKDLKKIIEKIKPLIIEKKILFLINDFVHLAMDYKSDFSAGFFGVHIGQDDMSLTEAREKLGSQCIIGVTVHDLKQAIEAEQNGADYVGFGAIFPTQTKNDAVEGSLDTAKSLQTAIKIPIHLIGGISADNVDLITSTGFNTVAISSGIALADNPLKTTADIKKKLLAVDNNL